jgi:hypothetical protein
MGLVQLTQDCYNGQVLSADSTQATGLRWVSAVGGGNVTTDTLSLNNKLEFGHPV